MKTKRSTALLLTFSFLGIAGLSSADDVGPTERTSFDIPPQNLEAALIRFSEQTDIQLVMASADVDGKQVEGVVGDLTHQEALTELLDNTGLEYQFVNDETIAIGEASDQGGASDSKNSSPAPILMAQNTSSRAQTTESSRSEEGGTSIVTGKVTDARTGANLKGVLVKIDETGQTTSTNNLGEFRFVNVPTGSATLTVSFLGYARQSAVIGVRGDSVAQDFALRGGSEIEEIVVFGTRSSRALALNQERTATNVSTVVSADKLGRFPGTTISDALRRVPGVSFQQDNRTGDGTNIVIRGLEPNLNVIKLNGIELPEATGQGRTASLNNILADSIESVTINKTLLPSHDSAGTGGLVEIETKSPLDRPRRFARLSFERGGFSNELSDETLLSALASGSFGSNEQFGVSASIQHRERENDTVSYGLGLIAGSYLPLGPGGDPNITAIGQIDPRIGFPFDGGSDDFYVRQSTASQGRQETENLSVTLSSHWIVNEQTNLRMDYQYSDLTSKRLGRDSSLFSFTTFSPQFVQELGGEQRIALSAFPFVSPSQLYSFTKEETTTNVLTVRGETRIDDWSFDYSAGYTEGSMEIPRSGNFGFGANFLAAPAFETLLVNGAVDPVEGRILSLWDVRTGKGFPLPNFTEAGWSYVNDPSIYELSGAIPVGQNFGENSRTLFESSVRRDFEQSHLKQFEVGVFYEDSEFRNRPGATSLSYGSDGPVTLEGLGLSFQEGAMSAIGLRDGFDVVSFADLERFISDLDAQTVGASPPLVLTERENNPLSRQASTSEKEFAAYVQARFDIGKLEVVGGLRFTQYDLEAANRYSIQYRDENNVSNPEFADRYTELRMESASESNVVPRILATYRVSDNKLLRMGYFRSIARPQISQLSQFTSVSIRLRPRFGPNFDQPGILFNTGNPDLKNTTTDSIDISFEYYYGNIGQLKMGAFYKKISNPIDIRIDQPSGLPDGVVLPDDPLIDALPSNIAYVGIRPVNNPNDGQVWGVEGTYEGQFDGLLGVWAGLGLFINGTFTDSKIDQPFVWQTKPIFDADSNVIGTETEELLIPNRQFKSAPEFSGTLGVTYNMHNVDAILSYTYQDRTLLDSFAANGLSNYNEAFDTMDLRAEYRFQLGAAESTVFIEGANLLRDEKDANTFISVGGDNGVPRGTYVGNYIGGRAFRIGFTTEFN